MEEQSGLFILHKDAWQEGIDKAIKTYKVAAPVNKNGMVIYDYITSGKEIESNYSPTVLPPKKFFFPQQETILEYSNDGNVKAEIKAEPLVLLGIRPCDLHGIEILDEAFADKNGDPNYLMKREQAVIIGMDCNKICDQHAFCYKVGTHETTTGFDLMLYDMGNKYIAKCNTKKGDDFLKKHFTYETASNTDLAPFFTAKKEAFSSKRPFNNLDSLPEKLGKANTHNVWQEEGARCLSCGSCIMVCPTCYCFDVADDLDLNLKQGKRTRRWDACMLSSFAVVASGENFRKTAKDRLRHRINRKFNYLMRKHNQPVCVGCGRCVRACLANISPKTIIEKINDEFQGENNKA